LDGPGGLPEPPHAAHAFKEGAGEPGIAEEMVIQKVQVASWQALNFSEGRIDLEGIERFSSFEEGFLVAKIADMRASPRDNEGVLDRF
jgi:hypothetical protein